MRGGIPAVRPGTHPANEYEPGTFRPDPENPSAPRLLHAATPGWSAGERPQALAVDTDGRIALLAWRGDGECRLHLLDDKAQPLAVHALAEVRFAYALD
ncbi:hypothetical protein RZS08_63805, partial [Arthrospira platensis SPKY1]|nr:hypothetical protein [Arthrospira platensis SPKY1]